MWRCVFGLEGMKVGNQLSNYGRGRGRSLSVDAYQIIGNMICALDLVAADDLTCATESLGIPSRQRGVDGPVIIAHLTQRNVKTLCGMWRSTRQPPMAVGATLSSPVLASGSMSQMSAGSSSPCVLPVVGGAEAGE